MSQVRLVQIGATGIQLGGIGSTLGGTPASAGNPVQLGKFNNTTGTFYKDPTNTSGGGAGQQIQMGTNLSSRTLGYIVGTGVPSTQLIQSSGYFSIWNNAVVQGAFQINTPSGSQAKPAGSQQTVNIRQNSDSSNHPRGPNSDSSSHPRPTNSDSSSHPRNPNSDSATHTRNPNSDRSTHIRGTNSDSSSHQQSYVVNSRRMGFVCIWTKLF
jgi:hypothetical protein